MAKTRKKLSSGQITPPIEFDYGSQTAMIADQANQIADFIYFDGTAHWQYLGTTLGTIADYRPLFADSSSGVVSLEYSEIKTLVDNSQLVPGRWYYILDFQTIHRITNTSEINIGPIEPLYIQAISEDQFSNKVYSDTFPNDVIEFDFTNQLCEDNTTPRKGVITFRKDIVNDTYTQYDWRHAKFRRWKITGKVTETVVKLTDTSFESNFVHFDISNTGMAQGSERFFIKFESGITHDAGSITLTIKKSSPTRSYTKPLLKWDGTSWNANELSGTEGIIVVCRLRNAFIYFNGRNYGNELIGTYASPYSFNFSLNPTIYYLVDSDDYVDYLTFNGQYKGVHFENSLQPEFGNVFYGNNTVFLSSVLYTTFVNRNDGNTFFEYTSDLTVAGNLTYCIFFKDIYNTVINDAQFSTFYTVLYILNVQNRIDASILYLHPFSSCELGEIEYSFIETFSSSNLGRSFVLNGKISFSFLSVGGVSTQSNFPIIPNGTQTSSVNVSKLTTFTFNGSAFRSLIGWFNSEGITLSRVYNFESVWEVEKLQNVVDKLKIDNLVSPVGDVNLLGRDEQGNVVDATAALGGLVGAGIGLSVDGNGDIRLGDSDDYVKVQFLEFVSPGFVASTPTKTETFTIFMSEDTGSGAKLVLGKDYDTANTQLLKFNENGTVSFNDDKLNVGIVYEGNYFTNGSANDRWIPDWGSVKQVPISVKNVEGTEQFVFTPLEGIRFEGTGDTSISFNSSTKTVTISSTPGAGTGGAVTSFNGRDGAVVSVSGDYNTSQVTESTNLYFTEARVRSTVLTGFTTNTTAITAADSVLVALGKAQGQINNLVPITRSVIAGTGLTGGGTLSSDVTLNVDEPRYFQTGNLGNNWDTVTASGYISGTSAGGGIGAGTFMGGINAAGAGGISRGLQLSNRDGVLRWRGFESGADRTLIPWNIIYHTGNFTMTLTGDVTGTGTTTVATTITNGAVTYPKIQSVTADRLLGRLGSNGVVQELTATQVRTFLNVADGANNYVHPTGFSNQPGTALTGASVISQILVNTNGHVTGATSRTLTLANLGYTGATNADNYGNWLLAASDTAGTQSITSGATVTITAGTGITATRSGGNITISSTLAGTNLSIGSNTSTVVRVDSSTGNNVNLSLATNTLAGIISASTQTIGGNKSFSGNTVIGATGASDGFQRLDVVTSSNRGLRIIGNTTGYFGSDLSIVRSGTNSDVIGNGPNFELFNTTTNRANIIQQTTGGLRFAQWNGSGWTNNVTFNTTGSITMGAQASATTHAVRADRTVQGVDGLVVNGSTAAQNLTSNLTIGVGGGFALDRLFIAKGVRVNSGTFTTSGTGVKLILFQNTFAWLASYFAQRVAIELDCYGEMTTSASATTFTIYWNFGSTDDVEVLSIPLPSPGASTKKVQLNGFLTINTTAAAVIQTVKLSVTAHIQGIGTFTGNVQVEKDMRINRDIRLRGLYTGGSGNSWGESQTIVKVY
jgi:hypothetical protein